MLRKGRDIHAVIHKRLLGDEAEVEADVKPYLSSVHHELAKFHDIHACEQYLAHGSLLYAGVLDCIAHYSR